MKILVDIFKSALWGLSILFFLLIVLFNVMRINGSFKDILPSNYASKAQETINIIQPELEKIRPTLDKSAWQRSAQENALISARGRLINNLINESCKNCSLLPYFDVTEKYQLDSYLEKIQAKTMQDNIDFSNRNAYLSAIFSALSLLSSLYVIYALIKYRESLLNIILFVACMIPILITFFTLGFITTSESFTIKLGYQNDGVEFWLLVISIMYVFTGYPAIYTVLKKQNINLVNLLTFKMVKI